MNSQKENTRSIEPKINSSKRMINAEAQKELMRIIVREKDNLVLGKLPEDHLSSERMIASAKIDGTAIKQSELDSLFLTLHSQENKKNSFIQAATFLEANEEKLLSLFRKMSKEKLDDKYAILPRIVENTDISSKSATSILRFLKNDGEPLYKEPMSFYKIAEKLDIKEALLLLYLKKTLSEAKLKITKKKFIFMSDFSKNRTKIEALFLMVVFAKINKYHFDSKHEYLFLARSSDIYPSIRTDLLKGLENIKFYEDQAAKHIEKTFNIDAGEEFLNILVKEKIFVKAFNYYVIHPKSTIHKYEVIEYLIAKNFPREFNINDDWEKVYREMKQSFPEMTKVKPGKSGSKYATKKQLKATATSSLSISRTLVLCDKSTLIFKQDLIEEVFKIQPYVKEIESKVKELGLYSLQNFWEEKKEELEKVGITALHKFYSLLSLSNNKTIFCKRYPSVLDEETAKRLQTENLRDLFDEKRDPSLSDKENQEKLGINTISYRQFFLTDKK